MGGGEPGGEDVPWPSSLKVNSRFSLSFSFFPLLRFLPPCRSIPCQHTRSVSIRRSKTSHIVPIALSLSSVQERGKTLEDNTHFSLVLRHVDPSLTTGGIDRKKGWEGGCCGRDGESGRLKVKELRARFGFGGAHTSQRERAMCVIWLWRFPPPHLSSDWPVNIGLIIHRCSSVTCVESGWADMHSLHSTPLRCPNLSIWPR